MISYNIYLSLPDFTQYDNLWVHPCCYEWNYFIFSNCWVIFHCIYVPCLYPFLCWWILVCFHVLAIVNSVTMNIGVRVSFQTMFFSGYVPRSGTVWSYGSSIFSFLSSLQLLLIVAVPAYISLSSVGGFPSLHTISSIYCLWIFFYYSLVWYLVVLMCFGVKECFNFIILYIAVQFSQHHVLNKLSSPHCIVLPPVL